MKIASSPNKGSLEVICGPMFSGKSEELIRRIKRAQLAKLSVVVFKHRFDNRSTLQHVRSHDGRLSPAHAVDNPQQFFDYVTSTTLVVAIDEIQFFSNDIVPIVCQLIDSGKRVIVSGLDLDFKNNPFGCMPLLLAIADHVTKLKAICMDCGSEAQCTQRLVNGNPARYDDPLILVGAQEQYQARCRNCHSIGI
ncbi:MAG: Thymidine kinase [Candidatus Dependentiae bacterium ADurb.Bin331]|nr:MAG: Thymidine kinase [Candidatus Dependentiae bacterium ADurb.Bin331]